jgi:hypothetical protein
MFTGYISGYHSDVIDDSSLMGSYVIKLTGMQSPTFRSIVAAQLQG